MNCIKCDQTIPDTSLYCAYCGVEIQHTGPLQPQEQSRKLRRLAFAVLAMSGFVFFGAVGLLVTGNNNQERPQIAGTTYSIAAVTELGGAVIGSRQFATHAAPPTTTAPQGTPTPTSPIWQSVGLDGEIVSDLVVVKADILYAATLGYNHGIFVSRNAGATWNAINNGLGSLQVWDIYATGTNGNKLYAGTEYGAWLTYDGGRSWQPLDDSWMVRTNVSDLPSDPSTIVVVGDVDVITHDGGRTWIELANLEIGGSLFWSGSFPQVVSAAYPAPTFYITERIKRIYRSVDGGKSFSQVANVGADYSVGALAVDRNDANILYACTGGKDSEVHPRPSWVYNFFAGHGLYKSTDGGGSWIPVNNGLPKQGVDTECTAVTIHPDDNKRVFVAIEGQVYKSSSGGNSWEQLSWLPKEVWPIHALAVNSATDTLCVGTQGSGVLCIALP